MKSLIVVVVALLFIAAAKAERYIPNSADPNSPDDCYHKELKLAIKKGETVKPTNVDTCADFTCQEEGLIRVGQCARSGHLCSKYVATDYSKEFPDCCDHYVCP